MLFYVVTGFGLVFIYVLELNYDLVIIVKILVKNTQFHSFYFSLIFFVLYLILIVIIYFIYTYSK